MRHRCGAVCSWAARIGAALAVAALGAGGAGGTAGGCVLAGAAALAVSAERAEAAVAERWVRLFLRDGRELTARVVRAERFKLVVETTVAGITARQEIARRDIESIEEIEVERPSGGRGEPREDGNDGAEAVGGFVVIELAGQIGREITAELVERVLAQGEKLGVEAVVFDLDTPGGALVTVNGILDVMDEYRGRVTTAVYVDGECYSGGAILAYCGADRIIVGRGGSMGAAVIIQPEERGRGRGRGGGGGGFDEVDAKFAAAEIAGWRARAERLGRDGDVVDAMASQEAELWAWWRDGVGEPPVLTASEPADADEADRVERVDSEQTVLALSADQMLAFGVADDRARDTAALGAIESLPGEHREDIDALGNYVEGYQRKVTRELRELEAVAERVNSILGRFDEGADGFEDVADVRRTLRRLLRDARNIEYRGRRYEYIELEIERHYGGMGAIRAWIGRIEDALERVRAM